jgi:DNA polymerase-1
MIAASSKVPTKKSWIDLFFGSGVSDESSEENHHKYCKTPGTLNILYQLFKGDLGLKLLLQNLSTKLCLGIFQSGLDALHAELVGISFSYRERRILQYPFRIREAFFEKNFYTLRKRKNQNGQKFEI